MIWKRRLVRVHFVERDTPSIEGVLIGKDPQFLRLAQPTVFQAAEESYAADGEAWIPRDRILWVQALK